MTRFTVRFRGYYREQVDEVAERVERALSGSDESTAEELIEFLEDVEFEIVLRGYARGEVNAAVREWIERLRDQ